MTSTADTRMARGPRLRNDPSKARPLGAAVLVLASLGFSAQATAGDAPKACRSKLAAMSGWMNAWARAMDRQPEFVPVPEDVELVSIDRRPTEVMDGMSIVLTANGAYFPGSDAAIDTPGLTEHLRASLAAEKKLGALTGQPMAPSPLLIAVDRRAPWQRVVDATTAAAAAGVTKALLLFRSSRIRSVPLPGPSAFDRPLREIRGMPDPSQRSERLARLTDELSSSCPALRTRLAASTRRGGLAPKKIVAAIVGCDCAVDLPALATFLWAVRPPDPGTAVSIAIAPPGSRDEDVTSIAAAANLPWSTAHAAVLSTATARQPRMIRLQTSTAPTP